MKNKRGFTLIEILAVVVILGLISTVSITALMSKKKTSDEKLAKQLEQSLTQIGEDVYVYELIKGKGGSFMTSYNAGGEVIIGLSELKSKGYLKNVRGNDFINPANSSSTCPGYLIIKKTSSGPEYKGYIKCEGLHTTTSYVDEKYEQSKTNSVQLTSTN